MLSMIETLVSAQAAVTQQIKANWQSFIRACCVPAFCASLILVWMAEAYWASAAFRAGQVSALVCAGGLVLFLSSLAVGRMVRVGLKVDPPPIGFEALRLVEADGRTLVLCVGLVALAGLAAMLQAAAARLVVTAFFAPGSDVIARPVLAAIDLGIMLAFYYLLGRLSLFLPAGGIAPDWHWSVIWRASEGHGVILFVVVFAVPCAAAIIIAGALLWRIGAMPWPALDDFARIESLGRGVIGSLYVVVPVLFLSLTAAWMLAAGGLCAAWEALKDRGAFTAAEPAF
jgi:hypothetical protein